MIPRPPSSTLFPYTTLFRSTHTTGIRNRDARRIHVRKLPGWLGNDMMPSHPGSLRSEEHTSELQSLAYLVCRLLLEKKKKQDANFRADNPRRSTHRPTDSPT